MIKNFFLICILLLTAGVGCRTSVAVNEKPPSSKEFQSSLSMTRTLPEQKDLAATYTKALFKTTKGDIAVALYADESPVTVNNFLNLAESGYYNGTKFHRVIQDFMIQGGDPNSKSDERSRHGMGGPGYTFGDEFNQHPLVRGSLAMANAGPNTNGSQFFIVTAASTPWLDGRHTNFGYVTAGMDIVEAIEHVETDPRDNPIEPVVITSIELLP